MARSEPHRVYTKPLLDKLGVKPGIRVCIQAIGDESFLHDVAERLGGSPPAACRGRYDVIFAGVASERDFPKIAKLREHLEPAGALWLVAPKGRGTPVRESSLQAAILASGLVDVKVVAFSATHTAVKAVIRLKDRLP